MSDNVIKMKFNKVTKVSAEWCGPCKQYAPIFEDFIPSIEEEWNIEYADIDTPEGNAFAEKYGIRGVPATVIERQGEKAVVIPGMLSREKLVNLFS
jgi:thioredoxin 1